MGYLLKNEAMNQVFNEWEKEYDIYAPILIEGKGTYADTDMVRYGIVHKWDEIAFGRKSRFSFKEVLLPISQTLFYFTEDTIKEENVKTKKNIVFLRSCDLHGVKRLDEIYLNNGVEDYYYKRVRENTKFVLIGCNQTFDNCFCVSMGTNRTDDYDLLVNIPDNQDHMECLVAFDNKNNEWEELFISHAVKQEDVTPDFVKETKVSVNIPDNLTINVMNSKEWNEYDSRCIGCGRCNFVCPTCTCFTMQDIFYTDNGKAGERRRVYASCMVDGYTDMAGNISFRKNNGQRMRFKVLHKVYDFKKRNGFHMCVGCGRCDDVCPEYISFSNCINKLETMIEEVSFNESK